MISTLGLRSSLLLFLSPPLLLLFFSRLFLLLLSFSLRSLLFSLPWPPLGLQVGSWLLLSRWRLLYFLLPPGFSRAPGEADGESLVNDDGGGEEQGGNEDQEELDSEREEEGEGEVSGDTWEEG